MSGKLAYFVEERRSQRSSGANGNGKKKKSPGAKSNRVRGRPRGNPEPLNAEQRRQRNAEYERERRIEQADALQELIEALHLTDKTPTAKVLEAALLCISEANTKASIETIMEENAHLERKITKLEKKIIKMDRAAAGSSSSASSSFSSKYSSSETAAAVMRPRNHESDETDLKWR